MNDMRSVIVPKSDQINADDLLGGPMTITVTKVAIRPGTEQPVSINFEGDNGKPYKPCKSMARVMVHCWGPDANQYEGRSMTLYCDPKVLWGGMAVGGIRISHMTDIKGTQVLALTATKGSKKPFTVQPLKAAPQSASPPAPDFEDRGPERRQRFPGLYVKDGRTWLANLDAALKSAPDDEEVEEINAVTEEALQQCPPHVQEKAAVWFAEARARVSSPPDAPPTYENDPALEPA